MGIKLNLQEESKDTDETFSDLRLRISEAAKPLLQGEWQQGGLLFRRVDCSLYQIIAVNRGSCGSGHLYHDEPSESPGVMSWGGISWLAQ
ncbi:MAG: hypothetical protein ACM359_16100 [Bacillota bacterium]